MKLWVKIGFGIAVAILSPVLWIQGCNAFFTWKLQSFVKIGVANQVIADSIASSLAPNWELEKVAFSPPDFELLANKIGRIRGTTGKMRVVNKCRYLENHSKYIPQRVLKETDFYGHYLCPIESDSAVKAIKIEIAHTKGRWIFADIRLSRNDRAE